jgi:hypothetical protein
MIMGWFGDTRTTVELALKQISKDLEATSRKVAGGGEKTVFRSSPSSNTTYDDPPFSRTTTRG